MLADYSHLPPRPTARLVVLDSENRILLLRGEEPPVGDATPFTFWHTPGGGLEEGETYEEAAVRELWEETGLQAPLGPCVWTQEGPGRNVYCKMRFYVVHVECGPVTFDNCIAEEVPFLKEARWWNRDELRAMETAGTPHLPRQVWQT